MVRLEKINGKNVWDALRLSVKENQREFVASNDVSIIEAYTTITANGHALAVRCFFMIYPLENHTIE